MAAPGGTATPKGPSSRLLSMKFMQRGAASTTSSPTTPQADGTPSSKLQRQDSTASLISQEAVQAAIRSEESKRQAAVEKRAAELGDGHWVLDVPAVLPTKVAQPQLRIVQMGYAQIDTGVDKGDSSSDEGEVADDRNNFRRRFNMKSVSKDGNSDSTDDETGDNSRGRRSSTGGKLKRSRSEASSKRGAGRDKDQHADKKRKRAPDLSKLTSISSQAVVSSPRMKCYNCHQSGHKASTCPRPSMEDKP